MSEPLNDPSIVRQMADRFSSLGLELINATAPYRYSYNFTWLGLPIIQFPQDMVAVQELVWRIRPSFIVETGIAHGGSLVFYASLLELLGGDGQVVGIDIDIRQDNRQRIEAHPLFRRIQMVEGSSTDPSVVRQVRETVAGRPTMVVLDSNHAHEHVLEELRLYSPLVGEGSYIVVMDTVVEDMPPDSFPNRPWGPGDNPKTAVHAFLDESHRFEIDRSIPDKLLLSVAPDGYLRCISDQGA